MGWVREYEEYNSDDYCKRLINLAGAIRFNRNKFVKSQKKNKRFKVLQHAKRVLDKEEYESYLLFYMYFKIDKRLHIINANKQLLKYTCTNLHFVFNAIGKNLSSFWDYFEKSKYKVQRDDMFGNILLTILEDRS